MNVVLTVSLFLLLVSPSALCATKPYKEPMSEAVRTKQPVIYARMDDHGFGVQYYREIRTGSGIGGFIGGAVGGLPGGLVGTAADRIANARPTDLSLKDAHQIGPLLDHAQAQREFEEALRTKLASVPLFSTSPEVKTLAPGAASTASSFSEDPVLVVELYAALTVDYRALQVTAIAYELSPSKWTADDRGIRNGRVYLNRFDYVSDLLPMQATRTEGEIEAEVAAIESRYAGRTLTVKETAQKLKEIREARLPRTFEEARKPLLEYWTADQGMALRQALQVGTVAVVELLSKDLLDFNPVLTSNVDPIGWKTLRDVVGAGRYVSVFIGGPFPGVLISEPSGRTAPYCQGTAFSPDLSVNPLPRLCAEERTNPGSPCPAGQVETELGCKNTSKKRK
jgi:hypothetical protein